MTVYLVALVYYMDPATRKVELLWQDHIPQVSIEQCHEVGKRYQYLHEGVNNVEVQYFCVEKQLQNTSK